MRHPRPSPGLAMMPRTGIARRGLPGQIRSDRELSTLGNTHAGSCDIELMPGLPVAMSPRQGSGYIGSLLA